TKNGENGFFGKVQKRLFKDVGQRIGSGSKLDNLKIIELKDLITKRDRYDEEFVKDVLSIIVRKNAKQQKIERLRNWRRKRKLWLWLSKREREFELLKNENSTEM
ncbi:hypothetical protein TNCV_1820091, partial [Trichonephila clavipes]